MDEAEIALCGPHGFAQHLRWLVEGLVGEIEGAPVHPQQMPRTEITKGAVGLGRVLEADFEAVVAGLAEETSAWVSAEGSLDACADRLGGIGGTAFTPIVNAPEVALLGVSRTVVKPVWSKGLDLSAEDGGGFEPRLMLPLSLSYDHRVIDGATGNGFLYRVGELLEQGDFDL